MNRNALFLVFGIRAVGALGYWFYQEQQETGVEIKIGGSGVSIEGK